MDNISQPEREGAAGSPGELPQEKRLMQVLVGSEAYRRIHLAALLRPCRPGDIVTELVLKYLPPAQEPVNANTELP